MIIIIVLDGPFSGDTSYKIPLKVIQYHIIIIISKIRSILTISRKFQTTYTTNAVSWKTLFQFDICEFRTCIRGIFP